MSEKAEGGLSREIVDVVMRDLLCRKGVGDELEMIDEDVREEMHAELVKKVGAALRSAEREAVIDGEWSLEDRREADIDEYSGQGVVIGMKLPEVGFVSVASVVYGCTEAKEIGGQMEIAQRIVTALNSSPAAGNEYVSVPRELLQDLLYYFRAPLSEPTYHLRNRLITRLEMLAAALSGGRNE